VTEEPANTNKILTFPEQPGASEPIELSEETAMELRRASFRLGIPEQELFGACLRSFIDYYEEHGHIPFEALPDPNSGDPKV
jgi:hypothetical protein